MPIHFVLGRVPVVADADGSLAASHDIRLISVENSTGSGGPAALRGSSQHAGTTDRLTTCHVCVHAGHSALSPTALRSLGPPSRFQ